MQLSMPFMSAVEWPLPLGYPCYDVVNTVGHNSAKN